MQTKTVSTRWRRKMHRCTTERICIIPQLAMHNWAACRIYFRRRTCIHWVDNFREQTWDFHIRRCCTILCIFCRLTAVCQTDGLLYMFILQHFSAGCLKMGLLGRETPDRCTWSRQIARPSMCKTERYRSDGILIGEKIFVRWERSNIRREAR